jgi:hypothetical protein
VAADTPAASLLSARASPTPPQRPLFERGERPASFSMEERAAASAEMDLGAEAFYFPPDRVPWLIGRGGGQVESLRKLCHDLGCCVGALAETSRSEKMPPMLAVAPDNSLLRWKLITRLSISEKRLHGAIVILPGTRAQRAELAQAVRSWFFSAVDLASINTVNRASGRELWNERESRARARALLQAATHAVEPRCNARDEDSCWWQVPSLKLVVELVLRTNADADEQREGRTATGPGSSAGGGRELAGHDPDVVRITAASPPAVALAQRSDPAGGDPDSRLAQHIPDDAGGRGPTPHGAVVAVSTPAAAAVQLASPDANLLPLPMTVAVVNKHIVTANCHLLELFSERMHERAFDDVVPLLRGAIERRAAPCARDRRQRAG